MRGFWSIDCLSERILRDYCALAMKRPYPDFASLVVNNGPPQPFTAPMILDYSSIVHGRQREKVLASQTSRLFA